MPTPCFYEVSTNHVKMPRGQFLGPDQRWHEISGLGGTIKTGALTLNFRRINRAEAREVIRNVAAKVPENLTLLVAYRSNEDQTVSMLIFRGGSEVAECSRAEDYPDWFYEHSKDTSRYDRLLEDDDGV
jgi:hypothetical protein